MQLKTVEYRRLISHGDYSNTSVGASADVPAGENPAMVLLEVQAFVLERLQSMVGGYDAARDLENQAERLEMRATSARRELERLLERAKDVRELLSKHGVTVQDFNDLDIPF